MKLPCLTIRIDGDDLVVLYAGMSKADALTVAKTEANKLHDTFAEYRVIQAVGAGIAWRRSVKPDPKPVEIEDEADESDEIAKRVRADLKAKGVKVPPRISVEKLLDLASEHGVEV